MRDRVRGISAGRSPMTGFAMLPVSDPFAAAAPTRATTVRTRTTASAKAAEAAVAASPGRRAAPAQASTCGELTPEASACNGSSMPVSSPRSISGVKYCRKKSAWMASAGCSSWTPVPRLAPSRDWIQFSEMAGLAPRLMAPERSYSWPQGQLQPAKPRCLPLDNRNNAASSRPAI